MAGHSKQIALQAGKRVRKCSHGSVRQLVMIMHIVRDKSESTLIARMTLMDCASSEERQARDVPDNGDRFGEEDQIA